MYRLGLLILLPIVFLIFISGKKKIEPNTIHPENIELKNDLIDKAKNYLIKDDTLWNWINIHSRGISVYETPQKKLADSAEWTLWYDEIETFSILLRGFSENKCISMMKEKGEGDLDDLFGFMGGDVAPPLFNPALPLKDKKIALDPGHIGGTMEMAKIEKKYILMIGSVAVNPDSTPGEIDSISFNEGNLTMGVAILLKEKLEKLGADVFLTRNDFGLTAWGNTYDQWLVNNYQQCLEEYILEIKPKPQEEAKLRAQKDKGKIFHTVFKYMDLKERAARINKFHPDLTLCIHFNVLETNVSNASGFVKPIKENYLMTFVPGAWAEGELDRQEQRFEFVEKLVTNDIERSATFSEIILREMEKSTGIPKLDWSDSLSYLHDYSIKIYPGVFARNLAFNRMVNGTMCFGETFYQDNLEECVRLNNKSLVIHGVGLPKRLEDVVNGYCNGILEWVKMKK